MSLELLREKFGYSEFTKKVDQRKIPMVQLMREEALKAFELWDKKIDKVKY